MVLTSVPVLMLRWVDPPTSAFMVAQKQRGVRLQYRWIDWPQISPEMSLAVIAAEDQRFPTHFGFDFVEIGEALRTVLRGGRLRGASTITQQVAKNLFLWSDRTFLRKALEAYFTMLLELLWTKQRILEVYMNIAQFGKGLYGVAPASQAFFNAAPGSLDRVQASLLASALPAPTRFDPANPSPYLLDRARSVRTHMEALGGVAYLDKL